MSRPTPKNSGRALRSVALALSSLLAWALGTAASHGADERPGLIGRASDGQRTRVFLAETPNFVLSEKQSVHPQIQPKFRVEWSGFLRVPFAGHYLFRAGDAKLYLEDRAVEGPAVALAAGLIPLRLVYERNTPRRGDRFQLRWQPEALAEQPVPATAFWHRGGSAELAQTEELARGRELIEELNCVACHAAPLASLGRRGAPVLTGIGSRLRVSWLYQWLENPAAFRPQTPMPVIPMTETIRADVTAYLAGLTNRTNSVKEPKPEPLDTEEGRALFGRIGCSQCHGADWQSSSAIGSKTTAGHLASFLQHPLVFDPTGRMPDLAVSTNEARQLAAFLMTKTNPTFEVEVTIGNPKAGRKVFALIGCLACHELKDYNGEVANVLTAPSLDLLEAGKGCLDEAASGHLPRYHLDPVDRAAVTAYLRQPDVVESPMQDLRRRLKQFRCEACHQTFESPLTAVSKTVPALADTAHRYSRDGLRDLLLSHSNARREKSPRMPFIGTEAVRGLVEGFFATAGVP